MIKWLSKLYALLVSLIKNKDFTANVANGISTASNLMIIGNLAGKDPYIKIKDMVLYVPSKCLAVAKYVLDFINKHKILSIPLLVLMGYGIFKIARSQLIAEGIDNAKQMIVNILGFNNSIDEDQKKEFVEVMNSNNPNDGFVEDRLLSIQPAQEVGVTVSIADFDKSGEVSYSEFLRFERLIKSIRRMDKETLLVLQYVTEYNLNFIELLKKARVYQYEKNIVNAF